MVPILSAGFLALRLHMITTPCSVPTINLAGPPTSPYSIETPPIGYFVMDANTASELYDEAASALSNTTGRLFSEIGANELHSVQGER